MFKCGIRPFEQIIFEGEASVVIVFLKRENNKSMYMYNLFQYGRILHVLEKEILI